MGDPKISLMIYGTRLSTSGWEPLVMLNNPPFPPLANMGVAGVGENPTYYTFRIDQNYTQYTLVYNPKYIKAHAAQRAGALKVSISIPKGYILDGGPSPYNVFIDIQRALETYALNPIVGKAGAFEFKATFPADDVFTRVLDSFRLVETKMPHRPMSSVSGEVGMIIADEALEDILFKDIQYPEFSPYKEIAVVRFGESDNIIKNLDVPRKPKYEIIVNKSNATSRFKSYNYGYNDSIVIDTVRYYGYDERAYEGQLIEFTINEALNGKYSHLLRVDKERECIEVTINTPKKRKEAYKIVLEGINKPDVFNNLRAYVNGLARPLTSLNTIELIGEELLRSSIDVKIEGKKYLINGKISINGKNIIVPIKEVPKPKEEKINRGWGDFYESSDTYGDRSKKTEVIEFKLILEDSNDIADDRRPYRVRFYNNDISFSINCQFSRLKGGKGYYTEIIIPSAWANYYKVALRTDRAKTSSNQHCGYNISPNTKEIRITKDDTDKLSWRDKMSKSTKSLLHATICLIVLAIVAFASIWINNKYFQNGKVNSDSTRVEQTDEFFGNKYTDELTPQINSFISKLQDEAVSFEEIRDIKSWLDQNLSKLDNNNGGIQLKEKVDAYMSLISVVETNANRKVDKIKGIAVNIKNKIEPVHWEYVSNVWITINRDGSKRNILDPERTKVDAVLKEGTIYKSFRDIPSSFDIINVPSNNTPANNGANRNNGNGNRQQHDNSTSNDEGEARW